MVRIPSSAGGVPGKPVGFSSPVLNAQKAGAWLSALKSGLGPLTASGIPCPLTIRGRTLGEWTASTGHNKEIVRLAERFGWPLMDHLSTHLPALWQNSDIPRACFSIDLHTVLKDITYGNGREKTDVNAMIEEGAPGVLKRLTASREKYEGWALQIRSRKIKLARLPVEERRYLPIHFPAMWDERNQEESVGGVPDPMRDEAGVLYERARFVASLGEPHERYLAAASNLVPAHAWRPDAVQISTAAGARAKSKFQMGEQWLAEEFIRLVRASASLQDGLALFGRMAGLPDASSAADIAQRFPEVSYSDLATVSLVGRVPAGYVSGQRITWDLQREGIRFVRHDLRPLKEDDPIPRTQVLGYIPAVEETWKMLFKILQVPPDVYARILPRVDDLVFSILKANQCFFLSEDDIRGRYDLAGSGVKILEQTTDREDIARRIKRKALYNPLTRKYMTPVEMLRLLPLLTRLPEPFSSDKPFLGAVLAGENAMAFVGEEGHVVDMVPYVPSLAERIQEEIKDILLQKKLTGPELRDRLEAVQIQFFSALREAVEDQKKYVGTTEKNTLADTLRNRGTDFEPSLETGIGWSLPVLRGLVPWITAYPPAFTDFIRALRMDVSVPMAVQRSADPEPALRKILSSIASGMPGLISYSAASREGYHAAPPGTLTFYYYSLMLFTGQIPESLTARFRSFLERQMGAIIWDHGLSGTERDTFARQIRGAQTFSSPADTAVLAVRTAPAEDPWDAVVTPAGTDAETFAWYLSRYVFRRHELEADAAAYPAAQWALTYFDYRSAQRSRSQGPSSGPAGVEIFTEIQGN